MIDIIVVNYKTYDYLDAFIDSVEKFYPSLFHNVTVYDVKADYPTAMREKYMKRGVYYNWSIDNIGYAKACNRAVDIGIPWTTSPFLGLFNADTEFINSDCIPKCLELLEDPTVGAVGPLQTNQKNEVTHAGITGNLRSPKNRGWMSDKLWLYKDTRQVVSISGSAYFTKYSVWNEMTRCNIYQEVFPGAEGGFLPTPLYYEETGYSYHLFSHGYKVMYEGRAHMRHYHNVSPGAYETKASLFSDSRKLFRKFCDAHHIPHD